MTLILSGTNGVSDIDGDASTPALRGTDANSGVFFGSDVVGVSTGGSEKVSVGASALVINDGGADFDFRVEGDTDANLLFVDASADKVGIGTSTPDTRLHIDGATNTTVRVTSPTNTDFRGFGIGAAEADTAEYASLKMNIDTGELRLTSGLNTYGGFETFYTNGSERMRIDTSGNVGVGATSPDVFSFGSTYKVFTVQNTATNNNVVMFLVPNGTGDANIQFGNPTYRRVSINADSSSNLTFATNGTNSSATGVTERARITSGGYFLVGEATIPTRVDAISGSIISTTLTPTSSATPKQCSGAVVFGGGTGSPNAARVFFGDNSGWTWDWGYVDSSNVYGRRFYFTDGGAAYSSTGVWGTISDARLKENVVDATSKLAEVMMLRVRNFNFISEPDKKHIGFIAQEIEQVFPKVVDETRPDEHGNTTKSVKTTVLIPILVKAIQELKAELDTVKAELATLKGQ